MDDPTHSQENQFWDNVTDWLLGNHPVDSPVGRAELLSFLRDTRDGQDDL